MSAIGTNPGVSGMKSMHPGVKSVYDDYPEVLRCKLLALRALIFEVAESIPGVGELEETLKWGQPSFLTTATKSGSTIRIDQFGKHDTHYAIFLNCRTTLVDEFREMYSDELHFEGNRAIVFDVNEPIPADTVRECLAKALTYHRHKSRRR